jgi:hypothetical protein
LAAFSSAVHTKSYDASASVVPSPDFNRLHSHVVQYDTGVKGLNDILYKCERDGQAKKWSFFCDTPKKRLMSFRFASCHIENRASTSPIGTETGFTNLDNGGYIPSTDIIG